MVSIHAIVYPPNKKKRRIIVCASVFFLLCLPVRIAFGLSKNCINAILDWLTIFVTNWTDFVRCSAQSNSHIFHYLKKKNDLKFFFFWNLIKKFFLNFGEIKKNLKWAIKLNESKSSGK